MSSEPQQSIAQQYDNEMRGVLFRNRNPRNEKSPSMSGNVQIGGVQYRLAGWTRTDRNGGTYLSLAVSLPDQPPQGDIPAPVPEQDDLPF